MQKFLPLLLILISGFSCTTENAEHAVDALINSTGWCAYEYKIEFRENEGEYVADSPYLIFGEYGSGVKFGENNICWVDYCDPTSSISESQSRILRWELISDKELKVLNDNTEIIVVEIIEISKQYLWIREIYSYDKEVELKLKRIK